MEYAYMGIFSSVFNWVLNKILSPVFNFLADLLSSALSWIFNEILGPLLKEVLWPLIQTTLDLIMQLLAGVIYGVFAKILTVIDSLNSAFDCLIGLRDVTYNGQSMSLLDAMFLIPGIETAFKLITMIGLSIACMLAVYATMKSTLDLDFENKRPVSRVLSAFFKCFIQLFTVQFMVLFMVKLSGLILKGLDTAMMQIGGGSVTTLGRMIFVIASMNACKSNTALNLDGTEAAKVGITDSCRSQFYNVGGLSYSNINDVKAHFDLAKFDYLIGIILAVFLLVIMAACLVIFVQRIFDMLMLYLVSPFFVAMIPLDDGEKFSKWRELFLGKCFGGFGMVMVMKMYIMLCPTIMGSSLVFSSTSKELDYLTKIVFILGGAWAVLKSGSAVTSLISGEAGSSEQETGRVAMGAAYGMTAGAVSSVGGMAFRGAARKVGEMSGKSRQKFEETKFKGTGGSSGTNSPSDGGGGMKSQPGKPQVLSNGLVKSYRGADGKKAYAFKPGKGKLFNIGKDGKGNTNVKLFGCGVRFGADGKVNKVSAPCLRWKKDAAGKMGIDRVSVLGCTAKKASGGDMYFKDFNLIGMHRKEGADGDIHLQRLGMVGLKREADDKGEYHTTDFMGLIKREKQEDGKYHITSLGSGLIKASHTKEEDGSSSIAGVRVMGMNFYTREDVVERNRQQRQNKS